MLQGTTPTLILTLPDEITPANVAAVRVDIATAEGVTVATLNDTAPALTSHELTIELTEAQTLALPAGLVLIQTRIKLNDGQILGFRTLPQMVKRLFNTQAMTTTTGTTTEAEASP